MAKYLFTGHYTSEGARGVLAEGGTSRREVAEQIVTANAAFAVERDGALVGHVTPAAVIAVLVGQRA